QGLGVGSPFLFEATCMLVAATLVVRWALPPPKNQLATARSGHRRPLGEVLRTPGVSVMSVTNAVLTAIQTGVLVFLFPLYLFDRGGFGPRAVGLLTSLGIVGRLVALWLGGDLSDRWGRPRVLIAGLLLYAALLASVPLLMDPIWLGLWSLVLGAA